jgi:hypothetical protein
MINENTYAASQQIQSVSQHYGKALNHIVDGVMAKLSFGHLEAEHKSAVSPRVYAELREAKSLIRQLRFRDDAAFLRTDELAWALKTLKTACATDVFGQHMDIFDKAAAMMGVELKTQDIPLDMHRKISNEVRLASSVYAAMPMACAV